MAAPGLQRGREDGHRVKAGRGGGPTLIIGAVRGEEAQRGQRDVKDGKEGFEAIKVDVRKHLEGTAVQV